MIDSHSHLYFDSFDDDREDVMVRAADVGVEASIVVGIDIPTSEEALMLSRRHECLFASAGIHPNDSAQQDETDWARLRELLATGEFVAVGETGLDFFRDRTPRETQEKALSRHIALAREYDLPLILHCREAQDAMLTQLEAEAAGITGIMHCFSGNVEDMNRSLAIGFDISFAGPLTYPRNKELRIACSEVPLDRVHIETDCPFLPPQGWRGQRNEPSYMQALISKVAECKGITVEEADHHTTANTRRLFRLS